MTEYILYGSGSAGTYALNFLRSKGIEPIAFADSNESKWDTVKDGVQVASPKVLQMICPDATWVATAISSPAGPQIRAAIGNMGVKTVPLWKVLPVCHGTPPKNAVTAIVNTLSDLPSKHEFYDQISFRNNPNYGSQMPIAPISELYFPPFITHLDEEHFLDAGAASGDTIALFKERWSNFSKITAFEPDQVNMNKLREATWRDVRIIRHDKALSDHLHDERFTANGDYSSHLGGTGENVTCWSLDDLYVTSKYPPTYIKMDI